MDTKKILGWVLLIIGLLIIFWGIYSSYNIFTGKKPAPQVFKAEQSTSIEEKGATGSLEDQMKSLVENQLKEALPSTFVPSLLNLLAWSIFSAILFFGAGKISTIGIKLIKK